MDEIHRNGSFAGTDMRMNTPDLQQQLSEKEELVTVLTHQLEQAAEQLDRLQRTGGVTKVQNAELGALSERLIENTNYLVEQWDESQLTASMTRVELQLEELRDLIIHSAGSHATDVTETFPDHEQQISDQEMVRSDPADPTEDTDSIFSSLSEVLLKKPVDIPEIELEDESISDQTIVAEEHLVSEDQQEPVLNLPDVPAAIDLEQSDPATLVAAIGERDVYIETCMKLCTELHRKASLNAPVDWGELNHAPEDLQQRLRVLESQLQEQARMNEVTLSLERARMSREKRLLKQACVQIQKYVKKHEIDPDEIQEIKFMLSGERDQEQPRSSSNQKWLSMLRINSQT